MSLFRKSRSQEVVVFDKWGRQLKPWEIRVGMSIVSSHYRHQDKSVWIVVK